MNRKITAWLSIAVILLSGLFLSWLLILTTGYDVYDLSGILLVSGIVLVGCLILIRRPENNLGWLFSAIGVLWAVSNTILAYVNYVTSYPGTQSGFISWLALIGSWFSDLAWISSVTFMFLLFPDGRLPSPRWRMIAWVIGMVLFLMLVTQLIAPGPLSQMPSIENPLGVDTLNPILRISAQLEVLFILCVMICLGSIFIRYRNSNQSVRQQIKWIAYLGLLLACLYIVQTILLQILGESITTSVLNAAGALVFSALPVFIGIAILRYRLWDIDVIIRRTLIYGALTVALALVYFGSVVVLQQVFQAVTGSPGQSQAAIVVSTLAVAALFSPLRKRVQERIDRRFYRSRYDAERVLEGFASHARQQTDLDALTGQLLEAVQSSLQPESVSIWLKGTEREGKK